MLFKILRGDEKNLPQTLTDGYCYFLKDKHYFYCDYKDSNGNLARAKLSSEYADKLRYIALDGATIELDPENIATKDYVDDIINSINVGPTYDETTGNLTIKTVSNTYFDETTGNLTIQ